MNLNAKNKDQNIKKHKKHLKEEILNLFHFSCILINILKPPLILLMFYPIKPNLLINFINLNYTST